MFLIYEGSHVTLFQLFLVSVWKLETWTCSWVQCVYWERILESYPLVTVVDLMY